jgi:transcriptional regulator with XRE-family HTH domain
MSLTPSQAKRLGTLIAGARMRQGIGQVAFAEQMGVAVGWMAGLEQGRFLDPSNERLTRIAEALDIEPEQIDRITKGRVAESLPELRTYFRAKYDLSPKQIERVERYIARLRKESP